MSKKIDTHSDFLQHQNVYGNKNVIVYLENNIAYKNANIRISNKSHTYNN